MPTLQEKKEYIREKAIEANESIKDLVFGCWIQIGEDGACDVLVKKTPSIYELQTTGIWHGEVKPEKIIGRPLQLADILLAIYAGENAITDIEYSGRKTVHLTADNQDLFEEDENFSVEWDLKKLFLDEQSDEVIEFIYQILSSN